MPRRQLSFTISESPRPAIDNILPLSDDEFPDSLAPSRLFFDDEDSRDSGFESHDSDTEISSLESPCSKDFDGCRSGKRSRVESDEDAWELSLTKKFKFASLREEKAVSEEVKSAVEKMASENDLVGDGSKTHQLPTVQERHKDLKSVSPDTVRKLLTGKFDDVTAGFQIIDCRYPYEYEGGHIGGAVNLHTEAQISELLAGLQNTESASRKILIFHCEFSSERAPKLLRFLRNQDRKLNIDRYPFLFYPEVYLLNGGYKAFFEQNKVKCQPQSYRPMLHEDYSKQLRHFRVKSKSWTAGEKRNMRSMRIMEDSSPLKFIL